MVVKRIVPNIPLSDSTEAKNFYQEVFDLEMAMDLGWVITFASHEISNPQISLVSSKGSHGEVPTASIEVENVDEVYKKAQRYGADIVYPITDEEWGVRRFYVREPSGYILNVLSHK